jgi:hypothetical protein
MFAGDGMVEGLIGGLLREDEEALAVKATEALPGPEATARIPLRWAPQIAAGTTDSLMSMRRRALSFSSELLNDQRRVCRDDT